MKLQTFAKVSTIALSLFASEGCVSSLSQKLPPAAVSDTVVCHGGRVETQAGLLSYRGCTQVTGNLTIQARDLSDLSPLATLGRVRGTLTIGESQTLETLDRLSQLKSVENLVLANNESLSKLEGLSQLSHVRGITLVGNPKLANLEGLEHVRSLEGLWLENNGLRTTHGLENLVEVSDLAVYRNSKLFSLAGLRNVSRVTNLSLECNRVLAGMLGLFDSLEHIEGDLSVVGNVTLSATEVDTLKGRQHTLERGTAMVARSLDEGSLVAANALQPGFSSRE